MLIRINTAEVLVNNIRVNSCTDWLRLSVPSSNGVYRGPQGFRAFVVFAGFQFNGLSLVISDEIINSVLETCGEVLVLFLAVYSLVSVDA